MTPFHPMTPASAAQDPPPGAERFGEFELLRPLGSGAVGDVWLARQRIGDSHRIVALKTLRARGAASPEAKARLEREARALLGIDHPGVCPIFDLGEVDGTPYIAMRHIPGRTLADLIAEARSARRRVDLAATQDGSTARSSAHGRTGPHSAVLTVIESLARALHAAHESGAVHRDVKPGNVMITPSGEPVLLDFGLARLADETFDLTLTGAALGTPVYMSPEQVRGQRDQIGRAADIWSLGVTAYECLTLRTPFDATTREGIYRRILLEPPTPLRETDPSLPRGLDAVLATALHKDPAARYASAAEFADDIAAVRDSLPTRAKRIGSLERTLLWVRRNRAVTALLILLGLALGATIVFASSSRARTREAVRSRELAESSFSAARASIESVVDITRSRLTDVPRFAEGRRVMLEAALDFYRRFADLRESEPSLAAEVAIALLSVSEIQEQLGRFADATSTLLEAERILGRAVELGFADPGNRIAIKIAMRRSSLAARAGHLDEALRLDEQAVTDARAILAFDREPRTLSDCLDAMRRRSEDLDTRGDTKGALAGCDAALALLTEADERRMPELRLPLARLLILAAQLEARSDRVQDAATHFAEVIALLDQPPLAGDRSDQDELLITALDARADLRGRADLLTEAIDDRRRAVALALALSEKRSDSVRALGTLAAARANLGQSLLTAGQYEEAGLVMELACDDHARLDSAADVDFTTRVNHATACFMLAKLREALDDRDQARTRFGEALRLVDDAGPRADDDITAIRLRIQASRGIACNAPQGSPPDEVESALGRAEQLLAAALTRFPDDIRLRTDKANLYAERSTLRATRGDFTAAAADSGIAGDAWFALIPSDLRVPMAVALATERYAREVLFLGRGEDVRAHAMARLNTVLGAPAEHLDKARTADRFVCDLETIRVVARRDFAASIARLRTLQVESDPDRPRALAALAELRAAESADGPEAASQHREHVADDFAALASSAADRSADLLAIERYLLAEFGEVAPRWTAPVKDRAEAAAAALRAALSR